MDLIIYAILGLLVLIVLWIVAIYNKLIVLKNNMDNAWAQIDVQLKRRFDLIPNLMETVKGYAKHEKTVFTDVAKYRSALMKGSLSERAEANNLLTAALGKLIAVSENYPQLKANENFLKLQEELAGTEDKISFVRTSYNDNVLRYNQTIQIFPGSLVAGTFHFGQRDYFSVPETEKAAPKVKFE